MYNILIIDSLGNHELKKNVKMIPRVGDKLAWIYMPYPMVSAVLLWPDELPLANLDDTTRSYVLNNEIDAIVTVGN